MNSPSWAKPMSKLAQVIKNRDRLNQSVLRVTNKNQNQFIMHQMLTCHYNKNIRLPMLRPFILILAALLTACAVPTKPTSQPPDEQRWQAHLQQMAGVVAWDIRGRVAIQTEDNGGQADLFWAQQTPDYYDIKLVLPFGGGTTLLQGRPEGVVLISNDGQRIYEDDPDRLLAAVQGWKFPVTGLRYWLLGMPVPDRSSRLIHWNEAGYLQLMEQDGWRIEMKAYKQVGQYQLPKKLFLSRLGNNELLDVRLVFRQWGLEQRATP